MFISHALTLINIYFLSSRTTMGLDTRSQRHKFLIKKSNSHRNDDSSQGLATVQPLRYRFVFTTHRISTITTTKHYHHFTQILTPRYKAIKRYLNPKPFIIPFKYCSQHGKHDKHDREKKTDIYTYVWNNMRPMITSRIFKWHELLMQNTIPAPTLHKRSS